MKIRKNQLQTLVREIICETLQMLQEAQRGEWWIYSDGDAQFADGDIGDSGHEGYVIEHVAREIYEHFIGYPPDQMGYLSEYENELKRSLIDDERLDEKELDVWDRGAGPTEIIAKKLLEDKIYTDAQQAMDAVFIAWGSSSKDSRDYAMKYLGWKRMTTGNHETHIQTWFLRQSDLDAIKRGIPNAWSEEYEDENVDSEHEVTIEVRANNRVFSNIPLTTLETAAVSDIVTFQRGEAWMRERKQNSAPIIDPTNFTPMG